MRIGLTYDLRDDYRALGYSEADVAEFDTRDTIDALDAALQRLGHVTDRIGHIRQLAERLVAGDRWDLVFNIAEGLRGRSREAQVPALLEAYDLPYVFSDPLTSAATLDKAVAKSLVRDAGIPTAPWAVIDDARRTKVQLPFPVFLKPLAEGTGKGCERASKVANADELKATARDLLTRFGQPVLAESYLCGREFTVGIVGNGSGARVIGVLEITLPESADADIYSYVNKEECETRVHYALADDAEALRAGELALAAYRVLGCRDAARLDFRSDSFGEPYFLEANVLAGIHPSHSDLPILASLAGIGYDGLISEIVTAAVHRLGPLGAPRPAKQAA